MRTCERLLQNSRMTDAELLAAAEALPDDPDAQCVARWLRARLAPATPFDPFADRMQDLLSEYALAILTRTRPSACEWCARYG